MYVNLNRVILNIQVPNFIVTNGCRYVVSLLQLLWFHGDYMHWCLPSDSHRVAVAFITAYNGPFLNLRSGGLFISGCASGWRIGVSHEISLGMRM